MAATRILFLTFLSITAAIPTGEVGVRWLFPDLKQYTFELKTNISTGSFLPAEGAAHSILHAKLTVQVYEDTRLRLMLDDIKTTLFNTNVKTPEHTSTPQGLPAEAKSLRKPWEAIYLLESGMLYQVQLSADEPTWSANIKRALAVSLQLVRVNATDAIYKKSYTVMEPCLHFNCKAEYIGVDTSTVRKLHGVPAFTRGYGRNVWLSVGTDICDKDIKQPFIGSAERIYRMDDMGLASIQLKSSLQYHSHNHLLAVVTEMSLHRKQITQLDAESTNKTAALVTSYPTYLPHSYKETTNMRAPVSQEQLMHITRELLTRVSESIDRDNIVPEADKIHSLDLIELHKTMSQLDLNSLKSLSKELHVGTSYLNETNKNIFMEALPHVKSADSAKLIRYLIIEFTEQKFEHATALSLVRKLPFNVAQYSQELLVQMEDMLNLPPDVPREIRHASILSFATLAFHTYINQGCSTDEFEEYVQKYFRMYTDAQGYSDRLVWLQGLANLQVGSVGIYMESVIQDENVSRHERFLAMWSTMPVVRYAPERTTSLYWPILTNKSEHIQLRITALLLLLEGEKTTERVLSLHRYIQSCDDGQLKNFWYTTVKSLEKSSYSCNAPLSKLTSYVSKLLHSRDDYFWATGNHIIDKTDKDVAYSAMSQFITIAKPMTGVPEVFYLTFNSNQAGLLTNHISVMLKAEGLRLSVFNQLQKFLSGEIQYGDIADLLKRMNVETATPEKVHIDLIINIQGKTVYAAHVNQSFDTWLNPDGPLITMITDLITSESHINQQFVQYPLQTEINIPTELGTPVTLQTTWCSFLSLRGTITSPSSKQSQWRRKNDIHLRYRGTAVTTLSSYCPVLGSQSAVRMQQSTVAHLPLKFDLEYLESQLRAIWLNEDSTGGVALHSRSQVSLSLGYGKDLKRYCPECESSYTVRAKDIDREQDPTGVFFDCDQRMMWSDLVEKLMTSIQIKDYLPSLQPSLVMVHLLYLASVPPSGTCGLWIPSVFPFHVPQGRSIEVTLRLLSADALKIDFSVEIKNSNDTEDPSPSINGSIVFNNTEERQHLLVNVAQNDRLMCLENIKDIKISPNQDILNYPAAYSGVLGINSRMKDGPQKSCLEDALQVLYFAEPKVNYTTEEVTERYFEVNLSNSNGSVTPSDPLRILQAMPADPHHLSIVERNGIAQVRLDNGQSLQFRAEHLDWLLDSWSTRQLRRKLGTDRECRLQDDTVTTLDGSVEQLHTSNCTERLILAECTSKPRFAVTRLSDGSYNLYAGGTHAAISSRQPGGPSVLIDNQELSQYPYVSKDFKITKAEDTIRVTYVWSDVALYYLPSGVVILVPDMFVGALCGSCVSQEYEVCP